MKFCAYHQVEHPETDFNATQLKRKNSAWCRNALAENKRLKSHGIESNSKAIRKGGRPRWDNEDIRADIKTRLESGESYSSIGRSYGKQAAQISNLAKKQGWQSLDSLKFKYPENFIELTRVCTKCYIEKDINDFPKRYDRPGKHDSRCALCLGRIKSQRSHEYHISNRDLIRENKRSYRSRNPEKIRDHSRKRRAIKNKVRNEFYTEIQIRERDKGLCYFCHQWIDPKIPYPDLNSQVIHHIHPLSKYGPNVASNVALAHNQCNARQHDKYESPFKSDQWSIKPISNKEARDIAIDKHYLHRGQNVSFGYGLYYLNEIKGMVSFGSTTSWRINLSICPDDPYSVIELNRLWISDDAPYGAASWFVSRVLKLLPPRIVVSYADTGIINPLTGKNHDGTIYRILSFYYAGRSKPHKEYRLPGSTRSVKKQDNAELHTVSGKERYWTVTGDKRDKKRLLEKSRWPILEY